MVLSWNRRNFAAPNNGKNGQALDRRPVSLSQLGGRVPRVRPRVFPERNLVMAKMFKGWNRNTDLAVDLKTVLHSDRSMKKGKEYQGVLRLESEACIEDFRCRDAHYTFIETLPQSAGKRNPHVFVGKYITVTRRDDGSLRPNFKPLKIDEDFSAYGYALGVFNELMWALEDLIEE